MLNMILKVRIDRIRQQYFISIEVDRKTTLRQVSPGTQMVHEYSDVCQARKITKDTSKLVSTICKVGEKIRKWARRSLRYLDI